MNRGKIIRLLNLLLILSVRIFVCLLTMIPFSEYGPLGQGKAPLFAYPRMLLAMRDADSIDPGIETLELSSYQFPIRGIKQIRVEYFDHARADPASYAPALSQKYLNMHHIVVLLSKLDPGPVFADIEYKVSGLCIFFLDRNWQSIILVGLVACANTESEVFFQISHHLSDKPATVQKNGTVIKVRSWLVVSFSVGNSDIFFA